MVPVTRASDLDSTMPENGCDTMYTVIKAQPGCGRSSRNAIQSASMAAVNVLRENTTALCSSRQAATPGIASIRFTMVATACMEKRVRYSNASHWPLTSLQKVSKGFYL